MTSRERMVTALSHREPDRLPVDLGGQVTTIQRVAYDELKAHVGLDTPTSTFVREHATIEPPILDRFCIDTRYVRPGPPDGFTLEPADDGSYVDEWGVGWKRVGLYHEPVGYPLAEATKEDLAHFPWPNPLDPGRLRGVAERARDLAQTTDYAIVAQFPWPLFEFAWTCLRGPRFLEDLILNPSFATTLLETLCGIEIQLLDRFLEAVGPYVQVIALGDDLGQESGPLISPRLYRNLIKPFQREVWSRVAKKTDAHLFLHSCGSVYQLIPDLIELGVSVLNPVQVAAQDMDTARLKREFGRDLSFWGAIDTQHVLPFGSPDEVREEVERRIHDLAPGGGYVVAPVHCIQAGVPPENILTLYETALTAGTYKKKNGDGYNFPPL